MEADFLGCFFDGNSSKTAGSSCFLHVVLALLRLKIHQTSPGMIEDSGWPYWYLVSGTCFVATAACLLFIYVSKTAWPELKDTAWLVDVFFLGGGGMKLPSPIFDKF